MRGCRSAPLTALVDGELDHGARERVHAHLARCPSCHADVEAQRALKARLRSLTAPPAPADLVARLEALRVPGSDPFGRAPAPGRPTRVLDPLRAGRPPLHVPAQRAPRLLVGALAATGAAAVLAVLGGPAPAAPATDPAGPQLVVDHAGTTAQLPVVPAGVPSVRPVGLVGASR